jgi:hypothetical protein
MFRNLKIFSGITILLLVLNTFPTEAQLLNDTSTLRLVKNDIDYIYNLQFREAIELYKKIVNTYPAHPVVYLLRGMMTYWENYPLLNASPARDSFEEDLNQCIKISEKNKNPDYEVEYLLANVCARGFLLMYYSDNNLVMEVIPLATSSYRYIRRSFDFTTECPDLYYFTGVYNYYMEAYPKAYPVYKPLTFMFPSGDIQAGLNQLNTASINSVVLRAEASYILTYIYENFENDFSMAYKYSRSLHELYPKNMRFLSVYLKNLLLLKRYDEADKLIESLGGEQSNKYLLAQLNIFKGILQEKKYFDKEVAQQYYSIGIREISLFGNYGDEYAAYGYFGLSRISEANGEKHASQLYRKEALRLAEFKKIDFDN